MRQISNNTKSAAASDSIYNESSATLTISGLTGAEVAPIQISGDNVNFVNYYEGGSLVQLNVASPSKSLTYPGYYRVSVPNTSAIASVSVVKPEWNNIIDRHIQWAPSKLDSNLLLWLDAIDNRTIIQVSSKVSQWNDLSGNNTASYPEQRISKAYLFIEHLRILYFLFRRESAQYSCWGDCCIKP